MSRENVAKIELDKAYDAIVANLKFTKDYSARI